jgi:hypothetical protein
MQPATIICDNRRADGAPCGQVALVHMVHYVYAIEQQRGKGSSAHVLRETHYEIECPQCGQRTQTVAHN